MINVIKNSYKLINTIWHWNVDIVKMREEACSISISK